MEKKTLSPALVPGLKISSKKDGGKLLLQTVEAFRTILNTTTDSYLLCDSKLKLLACNDAYIKLVKQITGKIPGRNFNLKEIISPDRKKRVIDCFNAGLNGKEIEYEVCSDETCKQWFNIHIYPLKQPAAEPAIICVCIKDITGRKAIESVAENSKVHERALFDSTPEAMLLINDANDIVVFNKRAKELLEKFVGKEIFNGTNLIKTVPDFRRDDLWDKLLYVRSGNFVEYEVLYPGNIWLWVSLTPVKDPSGIINEIGVGLRDVTIRKQMEAKLRQSECQSRSLVASLAEGVIMQTFQKSVLAINDSAVEILQTTKKELLQQGFPMQGFVMINKKNETLDIDAIIQDKVSHGISVKALVVGLQLEKGIQWLLLNIEPVKNSDAKPDACVISITDMTKIFKNVDELNLLSKVVKETSNLITITDAEEKIIWANETFLKITGYSLEEALNQKPGHILGGPEKDRKEVARMKAAISNGVPIEGEVLNYGKKGKKYWVHYNIHPVKDENGKVIRFFSIQSDITDKKKMQEELRQAVLQRQKASLQGILKGQEKERNELGKELHDNINQILAAVKLSLDCSLSRPEQSRDFVESAFQNVKLAMTEIRDFSHRLVSPRFQQCSFDEVLNDVVYNMKLSEITSVVIDPHCETDINPDIKLNLFRIVQEQLNNIVKYAKATSISLSLAIQMNKVILRITDNGVGFDTESKKKGIGLNNILNRAESLNGTAQLKSSPGNGCSLQVTIPVEQLACPL